MGRMKRPSDLHPNSIKIQSNMYVETYFYIVLLLFSPVISAINNSVEFTRLQYIQWGTVVSHKVEVHNSIFFNML